MTPDIQEEIDRIGYDLSKKVPDMRRGFQIGTNYGDIAVDAEDSRIFADLIERLLSKRISALQKKGGLK